MYLSLFCFEHFPHEDRFPAQSNNGLPGREDDSLLGTPNDIGFQHGSSAAAEVHVNVATYTAFFLETAQISWNEARERALNLFLPTLEKRYPEILEEMRGIANGTGGDLMLGDILTLNARSETALTNYADGCTSISQVGSEGEIFLAQNWNWLEELHRGMVLLFIKD